MVRRGPLVLLALLLWGCPDEVGGGIVGGVQGLVAPASLKGVPNGGSEIVLTWNDRSTVETGYRLEISLSPFGSAPISGVEFLEADRSSHVYPSVPNTTYYFRVVAITAVMESDPSNVALVQTPNVPERPTGVVARAYDSTQISVSWVDVTGETGYLIERSDDGGLTWVEVGSAPGDGSTFLSAGLSPTTGYAYRVIALNGSERSTPSAAAYGETTFAGVEFWGLGLVGDYGKFNSIAIGSDGLERLAFYDVANTNLLHAAKRLIPPSTFTFDVTTVDGGETGTSDVGGDGTGIAIDSSGKVHLVSHDRTNDVLRYVTNASGFWVATTVDIGGAKPRIACAPATGRLHVLYQSRMAGGIVTARYAKKDPGQAWTMYDFVPIFPFSVHSLTLDKDGIPHFLLVGSDRRLLYYLFPGIVLGSPIPYPSDHGVPDYTSLVVDPAGTVHAFYRGSVSKSLHYVAQPPGTSGWSSEPVHEVAGEDLGSFCSAARDRNTGRLHVASYDATRGLLKYARKDPGGSWVRGVIDAAGDVGSHVAVSVNAAGVVYIAYRDETNRRLKIATGTP